MKVGIIGVGNMGSRYAQLILDRKVEGLELAALTRIGKNYEQRLEGKLPTELPVFPGEKELFDAVEAGKIELDAVIIATPHYAHEEQAVRAFQNGLAVLTEKPLGVTTAQGRKMTEAAASSGEVFAAVFQQRTDPMYKRVKEIVESGKYGSLKRVNWVVTDWYRPEKYFQASSWHAAWKTDGGGVLLNQCPHNLDLLQWICGMPVRVQAFCRQGRFHDIEVEDDATVYMEWENGACGTFITSTGDAPGINRLEISLEEAMLVCENGELRIGELEPELGMKERCYRETSEDFFRKIRGTWKTETFEREGDPYQKILQNFADVLNGKEEKLIAAGKEGNNSLYLSNGAYLSSFEKRMVELPQSGTIQETVFEAEFKAHLDRLCRQ